MKRATDFIKRTSEEWMKRKEELSSTTLLLVARTGPTVFTLASLESNSNRSTYKVILGNPHICSCRQYDDKTTCIHVLYCLLKVLRLPDTHALSWQTSLTDSEIQQVLNSALHLSSHNRNRADETSARSRSTKKLSHQSDNSTHIEEKYCQRQELVEDGNANMCPICQDEMSEKTQSLTWCRTGCGNNMHAKCMMTVFEYNQKSTSTSKAKSQLLCPLCRVPWLLEHLKSDLKQHLSSLPKSIEKLSNLTCARIRCSVCLVGVNTGSFYRCVECSHFRFEKNINSFEQGVQASSSDSIKDENVTTVLDICQHCYLPTRIPKCHKFHHFLLSTLAPSGAGEPSGQNEMVRDTDWTPVVNPLCSNGMSDAGTVISTSSDINAQAMSQLISDLQNREITSNDYDALMALDELNLNGSNTDGTSRSHQVAIAQRQFIDLSDHLIDALPQSSASSAVMSFCCWCSGENNDNGNSQSEQPADIQEVCKKTQQLRCGHVTHTECLKKCINDVINDVGVWYLGYGVRCPDPGCGQRAMPGLSRRYVKQNKTKSAIAISTDDNYNTSNNISQNMPLILTSLSPPMQRGSLMVGPAPRCVVTAEKNPKAGDVAGCITQQVPGSLGIAASGMGIFGSKAAITPQSSNMMTPTKSISSVVSRGSSVNAMLSQQPLESLLTIQSSSSSGAQPVGNMPIRILLVALI